MLLNVLLLVLAAIGHLGICVMLYNRIHATGWPRKIRKGSEALIFPFALLFPILILYALAQGKYQFNDAVRFYTNNGYVFYYAILCWAVSAYVTCLFVVRKIKQAKLSCLSGHNVSVFNIAEEAGTPLANGKLMELLNRIPGNEIFKLAVEEKRIVLPRLPAGLDELSITHLSDLHFTGKTDRAYFENVIEKANALRGDMIVVTGDIIDKRPCMDWIDAILSRLSAPLGLYFVLGNHDRRVRPVQETLDRLQNLGFVYVAGRWVTIEKEGQQIHLCGNDLPWFPDAKHLPADPPDGSAVNESSAGLRILLSHSPDQVYWAKRFSIDLLLAGHTHGGQIRLPYYGSIVSASRFGNAFSAGVFEEAGLIMHVSRGISGTQPLRLNCLPEITRLILTRQG